MPLLMCKTMPTSEEFTGKMSTDPSILRSKVSEGRKSSKPLMEKRRRARINDSLTQLKTLILEATNKDTSRHSKLEKADILEMTVKYLKNLQRHHVAASLEPEINATRYRMGYSECIGEVSRFLSPLDSNLVDLRVQLLSHLSQTCTTNQKPPQQSPTIATGLPVPMQSPTVAHTAITAHIPQQLQIQVAPSMSVTPTIQTVPITVAAQPQTATLTVPNLTKQTQVTVTPVPQQSPHGMARLVSAIQVGLPTGMSGGEIALVIPPEAFPKGQVPTHFLPIFSQHAPVLSPSVAATTPSMSHSLSSPVGTATASIAQMPSNVTYQTISAALQPTSIPNIPSRTVLACNNDIIMAEPKATHTSINHNSVPVQTYVTLRSPLQTSHHQNQSSYPMKINKINCSQEIMAMEDDPSCWRPWQRT